MSYNDLSDYLWQILFKLDSRTGYCEHLVVQQIFEHPNSSLDLRQFSPDMIASMCIVSGCDYLVNSKYDFLSLAQYDISRVGFACGIRNQEKLQIGLETQVNTFHLTNSYRVLIFACYCYGGLLIEFFALYDLKVPCLSTASPRPNQPL